MGEQPFFLSFHDSTLLGDNFLFPVQCEGTGVYVCLLGASVHPGACVCV